MPRKTARSAVLHCGPPFGGSFCNEAVFTAVVRKLPSLDTIEAPGLHPFDVLRDLLGMFPSRQFDRQNQPFEFGGWISHDRFHGVESVVWSNIGIADQVTKCLEESSFDLLQKLRGHSTFVTTFAGIPAGCRILELVNESVD